MSKLQNVDINFDSVARGINMLDPLNDQDTATKNYIDHFKLRVFQDHFFGNLANSWSISSNGNGADVTLNSAVALDCFGIARSSTGGNAAGSAALHTGQNMTYIGGDTDHVFGGRFSVPILSTATQRFVIRKGLTNAVTSNAEPTDGVYLRYSDNLNSGSLQLVCRRGSTETVFNSSLAVVAGEWINWRIQILKNLNQVRLFAATGKNQPVLLGSVNGASNIPTSATVFGFMNRIAKTVGTTSRGMDDDLLFYDLRNMV